jgi:hypothetical protein
LSTAPSSLKVKVPAIFPIRLMRGLGGTLLVGGKDKDLNLTDPLWITSDLSTFLSLIIHKSRSFPHNAG